MGEIWDVVQTERDALAGDLLGLGRRQWATASLCEGWDVHDVLAHLVDDAKTTTLSFMVRLIGSGFNFDRTNANGVVRERASDPERTLAEFRAVKDRRTSAPAPLASRLVEAFVHGEDIRRPLGIERRYPAARVASAVAFQLATSVSMGGGKERASGLRVVATDADLDVGSGEEARGSAIALLLALSGRPVRDGEITGPGAKQLIGRR